MTSFSVLRVFNSTSVSNAKVCVFFKYKSVIVSVFWSLIKSSGSVAGWLQVRGEFWEWHVISHSQADQAAEQGLPERGADAGRESEKLGVFFFAFLCVYFYLMISRTTTVIKSSILYVILNLDPFSTSNTLCFFFCFRAFMYPTYNIPLNHNPSLLFKLISASSSSACHFCPV